MVVNGEIYYTELCVLSAICRTYRMYLPCTPTVFFKEPMEPESPPEAEAELESPSFHSMSGPLKKSKATRITRSRNARRRTPEVPPMMVNDFFRSRIPSDRRRNLATKA